jgi:hypothetical protein
MTPGDRAGVPGRPSNLDLGPEVHKQLKLQCNMTCFVWYNEENNREFSPQNRMRNLPKTLLTAGSSDACRVRRDFDYEQVHTAVFSSVSGGTSSPFWRT